MARGDLESLFERFRDHGDLAALAQVFDRTAPQLLSVARHLASAEAAAEDLVQATFVAAIEHAQRFEPNRELVPWLVGILTNKAKLARALGARETDAGRLEQREERDPALDAELSEFVATLERALKRVPSRYRDVLRRHLGEGQKPEQIARELGREQGTVRVQLHRALAHLRRVLPPGFALGAAVWLGSPRGLAAVRADVLRHAQMGIGTAAGTSALVIGGTIVTLKSLAFAAAALVAALGLWWLLRSEPATPQVVLADANEVVVAPIGPGRVTEPPVEAGVDAREPVAVPAAIEPTPPSPRGALDIEVVWHDGTPAPGVNLEITPLGERQPSQHRRFVVTDGQGHASVDALMPGEVQILDDHRQPGEYPSTGRVTAGAHEHTRITLYRGFDLSGRVVDVRHVPVAGAIVWYCGFDEQEHAREIARTDADGRFSIKSLSEESRIFATADGHGTSEPLPFGEELMKAPLPDFSQPRLTGRVDLEGHTVDDIELVLDNSRCVIEGVVHDPDGAPVNGARVEWITGPTKDDVLNRVLRQPALPQTTDVDGVFRFAGLRVMYGHLAVAESGFAMWTSAFTKLIESDVNYFTVQLERGLSVSGIVRDGIGTPLAGVRVAEARDARFSCPDFHDLWTLSDAQGSFRLDGIASGKFRLEAVVTIDGFEHRVHDDFEGRAGQALEWNPRFATGLSIRGRALDPESKPLVGWGIYARPSSDRSMGGNPTVTTDASGRFEVNGLADESYRVKLHAPSEAWWWVAEFEDVRPGGNDLAFVGDPDDFRTAFIHGRIVDARGAPVTTAISAWCATSYGGVSAQQGADGRFRVGPLQRGDVKLSVKLDTVGQYKNCAIPNLAAREDRDVGDIVVP